MTKGPVKKKRHRGYVLMEAMVGGALVAVALGIAFTQIAVAREDVSYSARHVAASSIARSVGTELASRSTLAATALGPFVDVDAANYPGVKMRFEVTDSAIVSQSTPSITATLFEIRVDVQVPTRTGLDVITYRTMQKD